MQITVFVVYFYVLNFFGIRMTVDITMTQYNLPRRECRVCAVSHNAVLEVQCAWMTLHMFPCINELEWSVGHTNGRT